MLLKADHSFVWSGKTLEDQIVSGVISVQSRSKAKKQLQKNGYFRISLKQVPPDVSHSPLATNKLLDFIKSLVLILSSGLSLHQALEMIQKENKSVVQCYICSRLLESLHKGKSIRDSFRDLQSLFPPFFISSIEISEHSGQLIKGLQSALDFYQKRNHRSQELKQITRYPKIVALAAILLLLVVTIFIIPMFQNIYSLFGDKLPRFTQILVDISTLFHRNPLPVLLVFLAGGLWFFIPWLRAINPVLKLIGLFKRMIDSLDDPYIFALAMKMQLENGQSLRQATQNAAECMTEKNHHYGYRIVQYLDAGRSLAFAFQKTRWFPTAFQQMLATTEKAGQVAIGFSQVGSFLEQRRAEQFDRWSRLLEPILILILGSIVLFILLAIYLPIFDLGNIVG